MSSEPLLHPRDLAGVPGLLLLEAASRSPVAEWPSICLLFARGLVALRHGVGGTPAETAARVRALVGDRLLPVPPEAIRVRQAAVNLESFLQMARAARDASFGPSIRLRGREHLDRALAAGRGAVLHLQAFHRALHLVALPAHGYRIHRVMNSTHGYFLFSRFGRRVLHPYQMRLEGHDRIVPLVAREGSLAHLRRVLACLKENRPVLFRALHPAAAPEVRTVVRYPFLEGWSRVSATPFSVALLSGAPLLPVYPVRAGGYEVRIGPPLPVPSRGRRSARIRALAREQARELEKVVLEVPDQWMEWNLAEPGRG